MTTRRIAHGDLTLALHELRGAADPASSGDDARRLLLVHDLEASSERWSGATNGDRAWSAWGGPVFALDLAGHGASDWRPGGAYTPELFAADIDAVLADVGPSVIAGSGIGAYAALLVAGARPDLVPAVLLLPGSGLDGGGSAPGLARAPVFLAAIEDVAAERVPGRVATDPFVRSCASDLRPPDYARAFAARARCVLLAEDGRERPLWWESIRVESAVTRVPAEAEAFARLARSAA